MFAFNFKLFKTTGLGCILETMVQISLINLSKLFRLNCITDHIYFNYTQTFNENFVTT